MRWKFVQHSFRKSRKNSIIIFFFLIYKYIFCCNENESDERSSAEYSSHCYSQCFYFVLEYLSSESSKQATLSCSDTKLSIFHSFYLSVCRFVSANNKSKYIVTEYEDPNVVTFKRHFHYFKCAYEAWSMCIGNNI